MSDYPRDAQDAIELDQRHRALAAKDAELAKANARVERLIGGLDNARTLSQEAQLEAEAAESALAAERQKAQALEALIKSWSDGVDDEGGEESYFHSMLRDGACKQCYPERDIKRVGWVCDFHQLRAVALGLPADAPVREG